MKIVGNLNDLIKRLMDLDSKKIYSIDIREQKYQRSLQQNKMLWKLIHLIAKKQGQDDMEVYCTLLERADAKSDYVLARPETEDTLRKIFRGVKFIRQQEVEDTVFNVYKVYLGSSKMTTKEMTELLEITIQICSELRIPTLED